jgi:hypothetical protein
MSYENVFPFAERISNPPTFASMLINLFNKRTPDLLEFYICTKEKDNPSMLFINGGFSSSMTLQDRIL